MGKAFDFLVFPLLLPGILLWLLAARILSMLAPLLIFPSLIVNRRLNWAVPFIPLIWKQQGYIKGTWLRLGFEVTYCMNVVRRFLTLPLRRRTADFFIVGFPKCGTTSMAAYLKLHPAISGIDGLNWHEALSKESHFFNGALGRGSAASSRTFYRSYFPTVLQRWWVERVRRAGKWLCFDACPVTACMDYAAARMARINPDAKLVFMLRDPISGAFSAEIMMRNLGIPLQWSFMEDVRPADPRFAETPDDARFWQEVAALKPDEPLPEDLMRRFYYSCFALLRCGRYADRIAPFLQHFKRENIMFVDFVEFTSNTDVVMKQVLEFVGADPMLFKFKTLPPGMQGERRGRRMHPSVKRKLAQYFAEPNLRLYAMLGRDFRWADPEAGRGYCATASSYMSSALSTIGSGMPSFTSSLKGGEAGAEEEVKVKVGSSSGGSEAVSVTANAATQPAIADAV